MKRIVAEANGGLTVLSAFSDGIGAAMSIDLGMRCTMTEEKDQKNENEVISMLMDRFGSDRNYGMKIESRIPAGYGLKSSSVYVLLIVSSFIRFEKIDLADIDLLRLSADISKKIGKSKTGAMDDLCQSLYGGFCMTDNNRNVIVKRRRVPEYYVAVSARGKGRLSSDINVPPGYRKSFRQIEKMAYAGYMFEPMVINGFLYGAMLGMDMETVKMMAESSALYSSQSGKGPAIFGIFSRQDQMETASRRIGKSVIKTRLSNDGLKVHEYED
ncbi:MAG: shikimate kinase [Thermoplasmata archaeon]